MSVLTKDWPVNSTDQLSAEDLLVFRRQAIDDRLTRIFNMACREYFPDLRPDEQHLQPDLIKNCWPNSMQPSGRSKQNRATKTAPMKEKSPPIFQAEQ
jgi:hypothetical protein